MEEWRAIRGYEGMYEVSSVGIVKGLDRVVIYSNGRKDFKKERILKPSLNTNGYPFVFLSKGNSTIKYIHRLVAEAFIPNPENKREVNHKNGVKDDNRVENLEWCTHFENMRHSWETGLNNHKGECSFFIKTYGRSGL